MKWKCKVRRRIKQLATIEVEADDEEDAEDEASTFMFDHADQVNWESSGDVDYYVDDVEPVEGGDAQ